MVRTDPTARSTPDDSSPTFSCWIADAARMRVLRSTTMPSDAPTTTTMSTSSRGSMNAIAMTAPSRISALPTASAKPCVSTAYRSVVSVPTRETRSPVRRASNSLMGRRRMRAISRRREEYTTAVPVRCSR